MNRRNFGALALLGVGLMIGLIVSRLFISEEMAWLLLCVAFLGGLSVGVFLVVVGLRREPEQIGGQRSNSQGAAPLEANALAANVATVPANENGAQVLWSTAHLALAREANRYSAQARDIGRYESVKFSVALPREWWQRDPSDSTEHLEPRAVLRSFAGIETLAWVMFGISLLVYAFTRFYKLDEFPISFLGDEAVVVTLARNLLQNGFHDPKLGWFPLYFDFFFVVNPLISVYLQAAALEFFGVSITVARAASALLTVFGAIAVALTLKKFFNARYWWSAILFLAITPTWFLHSRTAFDTVTATALYAIFIFCYLLYRYRSPRYVFAIVLSAAAMFYSYPAAQLVLALTAALLAISDIRFHLKNLRWWLFAAPLIAIVLLPYVRFVLAHPDESWYHLRSVNSYVVRDIPISEKVTGFIARYAQGISPLYWFLPNEVDLMRHRMKDYGLLPLWILPLLVVGIGVCIARFRESKYRVLLIALVSAPVAAALVDVLILRLLSFVIPVTLLAVLGMEYLLERFAKRIQPQVISVVLLALLSFGGIWMTRDALVNGPTWFQQYDLYGMQWGAKQLFQVLQQVRENSPKSPIILTSSWANGTEQFIEFFMPNDKLIQTRTIDAWIENQEPLSRNTIFVMTPEELDTARASGKFQEPQFVWQLDYPNGERGFEIVRMAYVQNIDEIFQAEKQARAKPVTEVIKVNGENITLTHSQFDSGSAQNMFDGDSYTLARGREANPLLLDIEFPTPRPLSQLRASFGQMSFTITVSLYAPNSDQPVVYSQTDRTNAPIPEVTIDFENPPAEVQRVKIEIEHLDSPGEAKIHVRELEIK
ncbi:MAG: hypothetical protein EYC68_00260 [Chloroflexota bacterium]|nr:MAG: hypothetical protein EYC68_00260 [Chloroflexota bacterium]